MTRPQQRGSVERAARRTELLDAADRVITTAGPAASMRTIAAAAGITKPILYRYFGDKGGLYQALAERHLEPLVASVRAALTAARPDDRVRATIDAYIRFIEDNPQIYRFLLHRALPEQPEAAAAVSAAIHRLGLEVAAALRSEFALQGSTGAALEGLAHGIVGMVHAAGDWWIADRPLPREELVEHLTTLLSRGLPALHPRLAGDVPTA